jgi:hypothetical protein
MTITIYERIHDDCGLNYMRGALLGLEQAAKVVSVLSSYLTMRIASTDSAGVLRPTLSDLSMLNSFGLRTLHVAATLDIQYGNLSDAVLTTGDDTYAEGPIEVWYWRPEYAEQYLSSAFGSVRDLRAKFPQLAPTTKEHLATTHIKVGGLKDYLCVMGLDGYYAAMQESDWAPCGVATDLIKSLGLNHTSMCTGDILVVRKHMYMVTGSDAAWLLLN